MSAGNRGFTCNRGFTYIGFLIFVAVAGAGLAAYAEIASHAAQREKEAELLFRGNAYQAAIGVTPCRYATCASSIAIR
jgi:hypothetical protein